MNYQILPINREYAKEIVQWEYEKPYTIYNLENNEKTIRELLENEYYVLINQYNQLVGFYCVGESAQVPIGHDYHVYDDTDYLDIGLGLNPIYVGKGKGLGFCELGIAFFERKYLTSKFRLTVFDFNKRAINIYHKLGFTIEDYFKINANYYFLVMTMNNS